MTDHFDAFVENLQQRIFDETRHCAFLAAETLQEALTRYMDKTVGNV